MSWEFVVCFASHLACETEHMWHPTMAMVHGILFSWLVSEALVYLLGGWFDGFDTFCILMVLVLCIECWKNTGYEMHPAKKKADIIGYHRMIMTYANAFNLNSPIFFKKSNYIDPTCSLVRFLATAACGCLTTKNKQNDKHNARCSVRCSCLPILVPSSSKQSGASFDGRRRHVRRKRFVRRNKVKIPFPQLDLTFIYEDRFETWFWSILLYSLHLVYFFWCRDPEIIIKKQMEM